MTKKNQSRTVVTVVEPDFIQEYYNRGKETLILNTVQMGKREFIAKMQGEGQWRENY